MSNEPIFIGSPTEILTGQSAIDRLAEVSDSIYETDEGVVSVPLERWLAAQAYERTTWIEQNQGSIDDRSDAHRDGFGNYESLPKDLGNVAEFGCGPFTQLRNLLRDHTATSITLVDPLAKVYQAEHKHCAYRNDMLDDVAVTVVAKTVEEFTGGPFDTVLFINVLSHCRDAHAVLDVVWRSLKPGGILLFHEHIEERGANLRYDVGHPLTVRQNVVNAFLKRFEGVSQTASEYAIATKGVTQIDEPEPITPEPFVPVEPIDDPTFENTWVEEDDFIADPTPKRGRKKKSE